MDMDMDRPVPKREFYSAAIVLGQAVGAP